MKSTTLKMLLSSSVISALALTASCSRSEDKTEPSSKVIDTHKNVDKDMPAGSMHDDTPTDLHGDMHRAGHDMERTAGHARDEVVAASRKTLDSISRKIDDLEARASDTTNELSADTREQLESLKEQRAKLSAEVDHAGEVSEDNWNGFVNDTQRAMDKLEEGYNNVLESMKTKE